MTTEIFNHCSYNINGFGCSEHLEFSVLSNQTVVINLHYNAEEDQDRYTGEWTIKRGKKEVATILYTPDQPMQIPTGGWLAQHPVTKDLRCHKHRRNARKWMQQSHSDFMQCDGYWDKQQAKELAYQKWVEKKPTNYTSVNDPDFLAWCNEDPRHRKTKYNITPSPIDLEF